MSQPLRVAVIGAGIGGLVAANALLRRGFDVEVYEQASELAEIGAGIQISPNALQVFRALDLEAPMLRIAHEPEGFLGTDWKSGRELFRSPIKDVFQAKYGASYYLVHRADLHRILAAPIPAERIHLSARCASIDNGSDSVTVRFADGATQSFDAVIGADGIKSVVRGALFGELKPQFTGCMCWRGLVPADRLPKDHALPMSHVWLGPDGHIVQYHVRGRSLVNFVAVYETKDWVEESWTLPSTLEEVKAAYAGWHPKLHVLFERSEKIYKWGLFDRDPLASWSAGRVTLMGDAAHPMLPFFAQGAGQAIEDGYAVAAALARYPADISRAFALYEAIRRERATRVQLGARARRHTLHLRTPWARLKRDLTYKWQQWRDPSNNSYRANWIYEFDVTRPSLYA